MKQVVISPGERVLNLYWFLEYLKLKNIIVYPYEKQYDEKY